MRHIPEEELHAYLDQALSRSQCVEIERHLARCGPCQRQRDNIAALRDRTTALLARIGPPLVIPPPFAHLKERAQALQPAPTRRSARGLWAAGIAAAALVGYQLLPTPTPAPAPIAEAPVGPAIEPGTVIDLQVPPVHVAVSHPTPRVVKPASRQLVRSSHPVGNAAPSSSDFADATETDLASTYVPATVARHIDATQAPVTVASTVLSFDDLAAQPVSADPALQGLWRTITPDQGAPELSSDIALVPGLPVIQMRQQPGIGTDDVTAVDQMLESGKVIRTISGPVQRVLSLVDEDSRADSVAAGTGTPDRTTVTIRQGGRMVAVTGPTQELGWLLSKVNMKSAKRRY